MQKLTKYFLGILFIVFVFHSCKTYYFRSNYGSLNTLIHHPDNINRLHFLKAHLKNGDVCILTDNWQIDNSDSLIIGVGSKYNYNRQLILQGRMEIPIEEVVIFETNKKISTGESTRKLALSILTGLNAGATSACLANPKACYGSCPTFYINQTDNFHYSDAEGFSNAILPSLEYGDIDALRPQYISDKTFSIFMRNEALETHMVRDVNIRAYPLKDNQRVYHSPGDEFYLSNKLYAVDRAVADEGDITQLLRKDDYQERFSLSDENNLSSREEVFLEFNDISHGENLGLVLHFRQSLMTTYFIYNAMGYMGDEVGDIFAKMEMEKDIYGKMKNGLRKELGDIEVYLWNEISREWVFQDSFYETGPIALNRQIVPLKIPVNDSKARIKLVVNKGLWRLDYAALAAIQKKVEPFELNPVAIYNKGKLDPTALSQISSPDEHLISMPGSEYQFQYEFPQSNVKYELFLYSKGYYLEWMRESWLKDKNLLKLKKMFDRPAAYLKEEAKEYKRYEMMMEQIFWSSKLDTKTYSYHEN